MKKLYLYTFLFLLTKNHAYSLEIDKKLLFSILNFSKSKRTLLINKGSESGLEKGDQAKFYIESKGLVARASVLKTSPTRSLWAVFKYRNKNSVKKGKVLKLIITKKIPLTNDVTKRVFKSEVLSGKEDRLPIEKRQKISRSFSSRFLIQKPKGDFSAINDMERPKSCLLYTSPSPRDRQKSRMPSSA